MDNLKLSNETEETTKPPTIPSSSPPETASPPTSPLRPSLSSSPSHEFSFTISLSTNTSGAAALKLSKSSPPQDFDLAPADDIFFQGHLIPLHLLHHRPSDMSIDNAGFLSFHHIEAEFKKTTTAAADAVAEGSVVSGGDVGKVENMKPKSLSTLFGLRKWLRGGEERDEERQRRRRRRRRKKVFDLGRLWKKYAGLVESLLFFKGGKEKREFRKGTCSSSGNCNAREGGWRRRWSGEFSAPASMQSSPANSGLLVAPSTTPLSSSGDSTMEELQNAIQAAIAHCKNSIAAHDRCS